MTIIKIRELRKKLGRLKNKIKYKLVILYLRIMRNSYSLNKEKRDEEIIVSLTSFPERFPALHSVIESMLCQTMRPDKVILYLDDDVSVIPSNLKKLCIAYGVQIEKRPGNMKPHKKYYYALKEHPNSIVITIDDDEIYPRNLIEDLYTVHKKFPNCVIAARAHKIRFNNGIVENYNNWEWESTLSHVPSMRLVATGCGGVLYPPFCMDSRVFDLELITKLSINADDLWLKIMQVLKHTPVVICNNVIRKKRVSVYGSQNKALNSSNVVQQFNDIYMNNLIDYFNLSEEDFSDE